MTARPVTTSITFPPSMLNGEMSVTQNLERDGPLFVASAGAENFPVSLRGRNKLGRFIDAALRDNGAQVVAGEDHVVYTVVATLGTAVGYPFNMIPADGFMSATIVTFGTSPNNGFGLEVSLDNGVSWHSIQIVSEQSSVPGQATLIYSQGIIGVCDIPPCTHIRMRAQNSAAFTNRYCLALSRQPRTSHMSVRLSDAQMTDNAVYGGTTTIQSLITSGIDATKRTRPVAADGTVATRAQGATVSSSTGPFNLPYYGTVLAPAIARIDAQNYGRDQPAALQSNNRGELKIETDAIRSVTEQQTLAAQAIYMQQLDPNWGFELR